MLHHFSFNNCLTIKREMKCHLVSFFKSFIDEKTAVKKFIEYLLLKLILHETKLFNKKKKTETKVYLYSLNFHFISILLLCMFVSLYTFLFKVFFKLIKKRRNVFVQFNLKKNKKESKRAQLIISERKK